MICEKNMPPLVILCGGMGTRIKQISQNIPKPMVKIGDLPIVSHIIKWYNQFGVNKFILCLGYKSEYFVTYFMNYDYYNQDIIIDIKNKTIQLNQQMKNDFKVILSQTGMYSLTGYRIFKILKYLDNNQRFFLTYGDGLSNVDINQLYKFHLDNKKLLTITGVHAPTRYGQIQEQNNIITAFNEKKQASKGYINGGFMVVEKQFVTKYLSNSDSIKDYFQQTAIQSSIKNGDSIVYKHQGFWQCMDTPRDYEYLQKLWNQNKAPWKV